MGQVVPGAIGVVEVVGGGNLVNIVGACCGSSAVYRNVASGCGVVDCGSVASSSSAVLGGVLVEACNEWWDVGLVGNLNVGWV